MHDYFDILGVPASAQAVEVRRRCALHVQRSHPDFRQAAAANAPSILRRDAAVDFIPMTAFAERIQQRFFGSAPQRST